MRTSSYAGNADIFIGYFLW